jgi:hypothetical protein
MKNNCPRYHVSLDVIVPPHRPEFTKYLVIVEDKKCPKPVVDSAGAKLQFPVMKTLLDKQEAYKLYDELKLKYEKI